MYKILIRPILFLIPPETIHGLLVSLIKSLHRIGICRRIVRSIFTTDTDNLRTNFLGIEFPNPVGLAAGFDKDAKYYNELSSFGFGYVEIGTVTPKAQSGNPRPRSFRLKADKALINRMGFNNLGVEQAVRMLKNKPQNLIVGGNIGKNTQTPNELAAEDFSFCFEKLYACVDYFVINVSCPNIGDTAELQDHDILMGILGKLTEIRSKKQPKKPILLKISPDLNFKQIDETISVIENLGIDGIVATNTTITRTGLKTGKEKIDKIGNGGLSGAPLRERSTEIIRYIRSRTGGRIPVIGAGGIMSAEDAIEKIEAGAGLIQIYTGFIYEGPGIIKSINKAVSLKRTEKMPVV